MTLRVSLIDISNHLVFILLFLYRLCLPYVRLQIASEVVAFQLVLSLQFISPSMVYFFPLLPPQSTGVHSFVPRQ